MRPPKYSPVKFGLLLKSTVSGRINVVDITAPSAVAVRYKTARIRLSCKDIVAVKKS